MNDALEIYTHKGLKRHIKNSSSEDEMFDVARSEKAETI